MATAPERSLPVTTGFGFRAFAEIKHISMENQVSFVKAL
jgi:hypothetical protein